MKPSPAKANIVRPASMDSEALGQYIADQTAGVLRRLEDLRPFYEELWKRFDKLPRGQKILGCAFRKEYCEKILHRSIRSVEYALYGRKRSLTAPINKLVEGLQSEELVAEDEARVDREADERQRAEEKAEKKRDAARFKKIQSTPRSDWTQDDREFMYVRLTEWDPKGQWRDHLLNRHPNKNLSAKDLKFVEDFTRDRADDYRKKEDERLQEDIKRIREQAEREEREDDFRFNPTDILNSALARLVVSPNVHGFLTEIVKEGFRQAAAKHHPDKGGTQQQMQDLNEANVLLNRFVRSVKMTEQQKAA
jgi:hypothetical protein